MTKTLQERKAKAWEAWYEAEKAYKEVYVTWLYARKAYEVICKEIEEEGE